MIVSDEREHREKARQLIADQHRDRVEKMRHIQEIAARYDQARHEYQRLMQAKTDNREQRVMLYAEIKALGWCMGREEKKVIAQINDPTA